MSAEAKTSLTRRRFLGIVGGTLAATGLPLRPLSSAVAATEAPMSMPAAQMQGSPPDWVNKPSASKTVRKSAESMTQEEIDRFKRAFEFAVASGFFDTFNDAHNDHDRQHNHGAEINPDSPITISVMPPSWGERLLPWHRAFVLEAETMLRGALRMVNKIKGEDPREADLLFVPYWNATKGQKLPHWVDEFKPRGGTAVVVPGLPKGHAGYGKEVGTRYQIELGRWPGTMPGIELPTEDNLKDMMGRPEFSQFVFGFDTETRLVPQKVPTAQSACTVLESKLPSDLSVPAIKQVLSNGIPLTKEAILGVYKSLFELNWRAAHAMNTDPALVGAVKDVFSAVYFSPHARMHLWAGGLNPKDPDVRGTVSYFNELVVDPAFWMIHTSLDRAWYMWEAAHPGKLPPLEGEDRVFNPLRSSEGAWFGGGRIYTIEELTAHEKLPYTYR